MKAYDVDLAHIHDAGFGALARHAAPAILAELRRAGIGHGRIVDLGSGSGILAAALVAAGYAVVGIDISPAMTRLARQRVPQARFLVRTLTGYGKHRFPPGYAGFVARKRA